MTGFKTLAAAAAVSLALGLPTAAMAQDALIGVLEEKPADAPAQSAAYVRALFHNTGGTWTAYDPQCAGGACFPRTTEWTVGLDGKTVGTVKGTTPASWALIGDVGRQSVTGKPPFVGTRSTKFAGWNDAPVYRPLVSTTTGKVADPALWKPGALPAATAAAVLAYLRGKFPTADRCRNPEENKPAAWAYKDSDVVVDGTYVSASGWRIARAGLKIDDYRCDGPISDAGESAFSPLTVAIAPDGTIRELGFDMQLLDVGDYDGNGASEVIFQFSHYNNDGYTLFTRDFAEAASFGYSYH